MACRITDSSFLLTGAQQRPIRRHTFVSLHTKGTTFLKWESLPQRTLKHQRCVIPPTKTKIVHAVVSPVVTLPADAAEQREQLCENYGFRQIGEPLPDNITLKNIIDTLPKEVFEIDNVKAWRSVLISATTYAMGLFMIAKSPWYLLPLAWAWTGTAVTGFFVIGHDCAHKSFSRNKLAEDIVGTLAFLPLVYPYEPWRFKHERHHAKTNMKNLSELKKMIYGAIMSRRKLEPQNEQSKKLTTSSIVFQAQKVLGLVMSADKQKNPLIDLVPSSDHYVSLNEDTAWHPVLKKEFEESPILQKAIIWGYGPIRPIMSIAHWLIWHFDLKKFRPNEITRVKISLACVFAFMAIGWPLIIYKTGIVGWTKFWLMPWLGYHFWMSTFTMVHHTAPHIPFKTSDAWNAAQAQLNGTVHCDYPRWIEILCHDINVHVPHHISSRIPSYNLRAAHKSLQENWGKYMNEASWNWRLMKTIMTVCHVYNEERNYIPFDEIAPENSQPIAFLKRLMPDYA